MNNYVTVDTERVNDRVYLINNLPQELLELIDIARQIEAIWSSFAPLVFETYQYRVLDFGLIREPKYFQIGQVEMILQVAAPLHCRKIYSKTGIFNQFLTITVHTFLQNNLKNYIDPNVDMQPQYYQIYQKEYYKQISKILRTLPQSYKFSNILCKVDKYNTIPQQINKFKLIDFIKNQPTAMITSKSGPVIRKVKRNENFTGLQQNNVSCDSQSSFQLSLLSNIQKDNYDQNQEAIDLDAMDKIIKDIDNNKTSLDFTEQQFDNDDSKIFEYLYTELFKCLDQQKVINNCKRPDFQQLQLIETILLFLNENKISTDNNECIVNQTAFNQFITRFYNVRHIIDCHIYTRLRYQFPDLIKLKRKLIIIQVRCMKSLLKDNILSEFKDQK